MAFADHLSRANKDQPNWPTLLLALMMVLTPALGVPSEELLQDTLKSILVSLFSLSAVFAYFWSIRDQSTSIHTSRVLFLPLCLMSFALLSMTWSHTYLAGVEAIRWLIFSVIVFLGINTFTAKQSHRMVWGIHIGATIACMWAALQYWFDLGLFPQGPAPAASFVNRNFFAEYVVCALPFAAMLAALAQTKRTVFLITLSAAFNITALLMTGTRSAISILLLLIPVLAFAAWFTHWRIASKNWRPHHLAMLAVLCFSTIFGLGSVPSSNKSIATELGHNVAALERSRVRTSSIADASEYRVGSMSLRLEMWESTVRMIKNNPLLGVGAGAWEVQIPRYQIAGRHIETDYYAHNEFLQLISEYGVVGWVFLAGLCLYLAVSMRHTLQPSSGNDSTDNVLRVCTLASLLALVFVSFLGFPWRLAPTGSLFAVGLGLLAASDTRRSQPVQKSQTAHRWSPNRSRASLLFISVAISTAIAICWQAIACESKLTRALKISLTISQSRDPHSPRWEFAKAQVIQLVREGVAINPHYRKLTPSIADALASWGDWSNANWIWESVLDSRPFVVVILTNLARGHLHTGDLAGAQALYLRAHQIQPDAVLVQNLAVLLLSRTGKHEEACVLAKELLKKNQYDYETLRLAYFLGIEHQDTELSILAQELRIKGWPDEAVDAWLKLGNIYALGSEKMENNAILSYRAAFNAAATEQRPFVLAAIPERFRAFVQ